MQKEFRGFILARAHLIYENSCIKVKMMEDGCYTLNLSFRAFFQKIYHVSTDEEKL